MKLFAFIVLCFVSSSAFAQPTDVELSWQFSSDDGATWTPDSIIVERSSSQVVRVRAVIAWQSHAARFDGFGGVNLDAFVAREPGSGTTDAILDPLTRHNGGLQSRPDVGVIILPDLLKIDRLTDLLPPGEGIGWLSPSQIPNFEGFSTSNPIEILTYSYLLDGSLGTRSVSAVIAQRPDGSGAAFFDLDFGTVPQYVPLLHHPGTITVIPAPPAAALTLLTIGVTLTRRRR